MTNITELQASYHNRTKDLFTKAPSAMRFCIAFFCKFSIPFAARVLVLILLFASGVYSQAKCLSNGKSPGIPPAAVTKQAGNTDNIHQTHTGTIPGAMLYEALSSDALPCIAITGHLNIRRYRSCESYKAYLAGIAAYAHTLSPSHLLTLSMSLRPSVTQSRIIALSHYPIIPPDSSPPRTIYKIRI